MLLLGLIYNKIFLNFEGLPRDHHESYHYFMWHNFFKHIDIEPKNVHILDGNAVDLVAECNKFEDQIREAGGVELFIGGIGPDGHIAFNEPGSSLVSRTRVKTLAQGRQHQDDSVERRGRGCGQSGSHQARGVPTHILLPSESPAQRERR